MTGAGIEPTARALKVRCSTTELPGRRGKEENSIRCMDLSINEGTLVVTGGPGDSVATAIVIKKTPKGLSAAGAEHMLLEKWVGRRGDGWTPNRQELLQQDGRTYDVHRVTLRDKSERTLYFDVTDWLSRANASA